MVHKALVAVGVLTLASSPFGPRPILAQGNAPSICIALARSEVGVDISAPLRDAMVAGLKAINANAAAVDSGDDMGSLMESAQKGCAFLVITRVQTHGGGGGLMSRMSNLRKAGTPDASTGSA